MAESLLRKVKAMAKLETTYGTLPTFTPSTDGFLIYRNANPISFDMATQDVDAIRDAFTPVVPAIGRILRPFNPTIFAQGSGTKDVAPRFSALLQACALTETVTTGTNVVYKPASSAFKSTSVQLALDGKLYTISGLRGTFTLGGASGEVVPFEFNMQGLWTVPANEGSEFTGHSAGSNLAQTLKSAQASVANGTVTWTGASAQPLLLKSFNFDRGINVEEVTDANDADGVARISFVPPARPTLQIVVEEKSTFASLINFEADANAGTTHAIDIVIGQGTNLGRELALNVPQGVITNVAYGEGNGGTRTVTVDYLCTNTVDNEEFSITHS